MTNKMRKKIISILLLIIMLITLLPNVSYATNKNVPEESMPTSVSNEKNVYLLSDCILSVEEINSEEKTVLSFTIMNEGYASVYDWSIAYEAEYDIISANGIEILNNDQTKILSCTNENREIGVNSAVVFTLQILGDNVNENNDYRIYGCYDEKDFEAISEETLCEVCDVITYDVETDETSLEIMDTSELMSNSTGEKSAEEILDTETLNALDNQANTRIVIGTDNRTKVTSVTSTPYYRIAFLYVTFPNGKSYVGTGFMVSKYYMLTAAHVLYNAGNGGKAKSVEAYFGVNGTSYEHKYTASSWSYCATYPSSIAIADDWGVIKFKSNVGSVTGWFSVGYNTNSKLEEMTFTVCGYPSDKFKTDADGIHGKARYMYRASSSPHAIKTNQIQYKIDTEGGQSGSPVYNSSTRVVYGIHHGSGSSSYNTSRRITKTLYNTFINKGYISE